MKTQVLAGDGKAIVHEAGSVQVLYSYEVPWAVRWGDGSSSRRESYVSDTTERHIEKFLDGAADPVRFPDTRFEFLAREATRRGLDEEDFRGVHREG